MPRSLWDGGAKLQLLGMVAGLRQGQPDDFTTFLTAVIDKAAFKSHTTYIEGARSNHSCTIIAGGKYSDAQGYFIEPTIIVTTDPKSTTMQEEIFGPVLTVYVYDDSKPNYWADIMTLVDSTSPFALTGAIFANDRHALIQGTEGLRHACGNLYLNDKCTGAVVGEQAFGGGRASGTNDKAGSPLNLLRWVNARTIKERTIPLSSIGYPSMQ